MGQIKPLLLISILLCAIQTPASAENIATQDASGKAPSMPIQTQKETSLAREILPELLIRPMGVLGSIAGAAFFVAGSPFSGLASIPEPHDAFMKTYEDFVLTPFNFTFRRPLGKYAVPIYDK